ncbi:MULTISPECIES: helix-turn-helix domain-containing protein [Enterobacter]|uniref:winged helix-turn-helix transcriptional regulator n=1 Tax=Enterobacter TaxID=547 RepID=UPI0004883C7F|nr:MULTISPECIES: helix-turn-helix domain-containing protein [Enterobacter]MBM1020104.1 helix-turn-helix transcriptional regulator [Enterobacter sp. E1]HDT2075657.1 helix-turn-helix transcriptional regulator [Enterobacter roggenkampii]HEG2002709.1 helix-turn-helix transcriptional regulator [Enterobacter asburiae]MCD2461316.1 helix-turn-helix transcriptional regulator [Enterobacter cloacae complex sp. 2021EL-01261]MCR1302750.1 helix-turn-helix transcriptional regulator [Enterobacter sp. FL1277]
MKRTRLEESTCPVARSLDIIGDWWSLLIVRDALRGITRFGEFQKSLGIAKNMLTTRLKLLVDEGILTLQPASDGSAWQEYVLTDKGRALQTVLVALSQWGNEFLFAEDEFGTVLVDTERRKPLRKLALIADDGRELTPEEIVPKLPS